MKESNRILVLFPFLVFLLISASSAQDNIDFNTFFKDETMRVDFEHLGDAEMEHVVVDRIYSNGSWGGSIINLIDTFNFGNYRYKIVDAESGKLIFSKDYNSSFGEYELTTMARGGELMSFHESALFPSPKNEIEFSLWKRNKIKGFDKLFSLNIDPAAYNIIRNEGADPSVIVYPHQYKGSSHQKVDVVYVAEGYQADEVKKFENDLERFCESLFVHEPMRSNRDNFNVWGVFKASPDSGTDQPRHNSFRRTHIGASFNSFGTERYLLINDNKAMRDIAGHVPYDAIFVLVNHERYGGAGMYNLYCTLTSDNVHSDFLMVHEFGHSFFGLADEYYSSETAFGDMYGQGHEPYEANITAETDPAKLKWRHLVEDGVPVPTPWEKKEYDGAAVAWQQERAKLKEAIAKLVREDADADAIEDARNLFKDKDAAHAEKMYNYLHSGMYAGKVGAFEGAGYISEGMYRPSKDCIMFTKRAPDFCPVCRESMQKVIDWYCK